MKKLTLQISLLLLVQVFIFNQGVNAQNSGPVAPEAMAFEPVDATDMVNLATGDFSYVLPLLEVPGPEGGYPIALSYHGGVTMDQEASWVGLGWNVNPGAINRSVNGFPDDWKDKLFANIIHDDGGSIDQHSLSVGIPVLPTLSVGLNIAWGSQKAFGGFVSLGVKGTPLSVTVSAGTNGVSVGIGLNLGSGVNLGVSAGSNGTSGSVGFLGAKLSMSEKGMSASYTDAINLGPLGISISSDAGVGVSILGMTLPIAYNDVTSKADYVIKRSGCDINFLIGEYHHRKETWWLFQMKKKFASGTLYLEDARDNISESNNFGTQSKYKKMDVSVVPDHATKWKNLESHSNNLMFPAYDNYQVNAQGIGGSITPRILEAGSLVGDVRDLYRNSDGNAESKLFYYYFPMDDKDIYNASASEIYFSFNYGNSSYLKVEADDWTRIRDNDNVIEDWGNNGGALDTDNQLSESNYNAAKKRRKTGKYVEWITNYDIANNVDLDRRGFLRPEGVNNSERVNTDLFDPDGIGAILITAEDGKTYHYSLPVYQFEEIYRDEADKDATGTFKDFYEKRKLEKYAYTWLLTAVTGPDYIDVNNDGMVSLDDYGYWVKFNYGKWTDGYIWQSPYGDLDKIYYKDDSEEEEHRAYSFGRKQIYYMNSIQTRTHTAYFVKSIRRDGKGKSMVVSSPEYSSGYYPTSEVKLIDGYTWEAQADIYSSEYYMPIKHEVLKLDEIYLINNKDLIANIEGRSSDLVDESELDQCYFNFIHDEYTMHCIALEVLGEIKPACTEGIIPVTKDITRSFGIYYENNVLDIYDIPAYLKSKAIKVIKFGHDYDLCRGTPNSNGYHNQKLTLNRLMTYGLNMTKVVPDYNFNYYTGANIAETDGRYNKDHTDTWGYNQGENGSEERNKPAHVWSLEEIETPLGSKINIEYESDSYIREAALGDGNNRYTVTLTVATGDNNYMADLGENVTPSLKFDLNETYNLNVQYRAKRDDPDDPGDPYEEINKDVSAQVISQHDGSHKVKLFITDGLIQDDLDYGKFILTGKYRILYGGGVRTTKILLEDEIGTYQTLYSYNDPIEDKTSGVTSYTPFDIQNKYVPFISELPVPNVMYEYVTVEEQGINGESNGITQYKFEVLQGSQNPTSEEFSMGDLFKVENTQNSPLNWYTDPSGHDHSIYLRNAVIRDNKSALGRLLSIKEINSDNQELKTIEYEYYKPDYVEGNNPEITSGILQESFKYRKRNYNSTFNNSTWSFTTSSRCMYPNIPWSTTITEKGMTSITNQSKYDFNTGQLLEQWTYLPAITKAIKTVKTPAYTIYNGATSDDISDIGMGSKVDNIYNKNMMVQLAGEKAYHVTVTNADSLLGASVQTWKSNWGYIDPVTGNNDESEMSPIWRKSKSYSWKGDVTEKGYYKDFDETKDFDYSATDAVNKTKGWEKSSEVTKYNHYSAALEAKDINDKYAASRMDIDEERVVATVANANYQSFTYTGFEKEKTQGNKYFGGEVYVTGASGIVADSQQEPHTGVSSLFLASGDPLTFILNDFQGHRNYRASIWVNTTSNDVKVTAENISNELIAEKMISEADIQMGNWKLLTLNFLTLDGRHDVTVKVINSGSEDVYLDDFRVHPIDAPMRSYVYHEATGLVSAILNNENIATKFEYDNAGRLKETYKETPNGFVRISEHEYVYAGAMFECTKLITQYTGSLSDSLEVTAEIRNRNDFAVTQDVHIFVDNRTQMIFSDVTFTGNETKTFTHNFGKYIYCDVNYGSIEMNNQIIHDFQFPKSNCPADMDINEKESITFGMTDTDGYFFSFSFSIHNYGCSSGGGEIDVNILKKNSDGNFVDVSDDYTFNYSTVLTSPLTLAPCSPYYVVSGGIEKHHVADGTYKLVYKCGSTETVSEEVVIEGGATPEPPPLPTLSGVTIVVEGETGDNINIVVEDGEITCSVILSGGINSNDPGVDIEWSYGKSGTIHEYPLNIPVPDPTFDGKIWVTVEYNNIIKEDDVLIDYTVE